MSRWPSGKIRVRLLELVGCVALAIVTAATPAAASIAKTCAPEPGTTSMVYGDFFSTLCAIDPIGDADGFEFPTVAGDVIRLIGADSGGSSSAHLCLDVFSASSGVFGSACGNFVAFLEGTITVSDTYLILAQESLYDAALPYSLSLERIFPPRPGWPALSFGAVANGDLARGDMDGFRLTATAGDYLTFTANDTGGLFGSICIEVISPTGATAVSPLCGELSAQQSVNAVESGEYSVLVYEGSYDQAISYDLSVDCLSGACMPRPYQENIGVYNGSSWRLDGNGNGVPDDSTFSFAASEAERLTGDWNGDGRDEIGLFTNGFWYLDYDGDGAWDGAGGDKAYHFGWAGVEPLIGDWNGDGRDTIGFFIDGFWYLDADGDGTWDGPGIDIQAHFGFNGVTPFAGDWNGDGREKIGFYINGFWYLDYNGNALWDGPGVDFQTEFGWGPVTPLVGDWDGDGHDTVGIYYNGFWFLDADGDGVWDGPGVDIQAEFGFTGVTPIVSDWNGDGRDKIGIVVNGFWYLDYDGSAAWDGGVNDKAYDYGEFGDIPIIGRW